MSTLYYSSTLVFSSSLFSLFINSFFFASFSSWVLHHYASQMSTTVYSGSVWQVLVSFEAFVGFWLSKGGSSCTIQSWLVSLSYSVGRWTHLVIRILRLMRVSCNVLCSKWNAVLQIFGQIIYTKFFTLRLHVNFEAMCLK